MRLVRPANAAITLMHSRKGVGLTRRSVCQIESTPPASHRSTQRQKAAAPENGNSISPTPTATFLGTFFGMVSPLVGPGMRVAMVQVGIVRVLVDDRQVPVRMGVRLAYRVA